MSNEPDINKIAATVIQGQISNAIAAVSKGFKVAVTKILEVINHDLTKYTAAKIKKCSYIKTPIINRDHAVYIYDIYVKTRLRVRRDIVGDETFIASLTGRDSIVVSGNAGSGKSMFMRHLFLRLCNEKRTKIPLFFELRDINNSEKKDLKEFLYYNLIGSSATITQAQFLDSLRAGVFCLILDGFDEVNFDDREEIEKQIRTLRDQCPDLQIIVSSRPDADRRLESWQAFDVIYVEPMEEPQATELIHKLEYDAKVKEKFLKEAKAKLFKSHKTFLSNPLLCIMMLVTFEQTGHIPAKRHVFFEKAFDALFSIHDTAKEGVYKRKTYSNLSVDDFRNCMSAFCIVTYLQEQFVFSRLAFRSALQQALSLEKLAVNIDDLISDMIESTCLLQVEGTDYVFTHRSFQEYFAAFYICRSPAGGVAPLIERVGYRSSTDDVVSLAYSINRGLIEREWIIPILEKMLGDHVDVVNNPMGFIREIGGAFLDVRPNGLPDLVLLYNPRGRSLYICAMLFHMHPTGWPGPGPDFPSTVADREIANAHYNDLARKKDKRLNDRSYHGNRLIQLTEEDDWILETSLPNFLIRFVGSLRQLLEICKQEARAQEDILSQLGLPRAAIAEGRFRKPK